MANVLTPKQQRELKRAKDVSARLGGLVKRGFGDVDVSQLGPEDDIRQIPQLFSPTPASDESKTVRRYTPRENPYEGADKSFTSEDADRIRQETAERMQAQIDSIENVYTRLIGDEQQRGEERAGRTRAISARGGLAGSPRGAAQKEQTSRYNKQLIENLQAQKAAEINAVYTKIDDRAEERIEAEREVAQGNLDNYLAYLEKYREDARADAALLGATGYTIDDLDPADVDDLLKDTGFRSRVLLEAHINANRPSEAKIDYRYQYDEATGEVLAYGVDPVTGELVSMKSELGTPRPTTNSKLEQFPDGRLAWVDEENQSIEFIEGINVGKKDKDEDDSVLPTFREESSVRIKNAVDELYKRVSATTVGIGSLGRYVPGSPQRDFEADLDTLKANIGFQILQQMREASKTGGALGQVSERENILLQSTLGALDQGQSPENFRKNLDKIKKSIERFEEAVQKEKSGQSGLDEVKEAATNAGYAEEEVDQLRTEGYSDEQIMSIIGS